MEALLGKDSLYIGISVPLPFLIVKGTYMYRSISENVKLYIPFCPSYPQAHFFFAYLKLIQTSKNLIL